MVSRTKWTLPSPNRNMHPPVWNAYASLLLLQLMTHGPPKVNPSVVVPSTQYSLSGSAQPAPLARDAGFGVFLTHRTGRPASSVQKMVFELPSPMPTNVTCGRLL